MVIVTWMARRVSVKSDVAGSPWRTSSLNVTRINPPSGLPLIPFPSSVNVESGAVSWPLMRRLLKLLEPE